MGPSSHGNNVYRLLLHSHQWWTYWLHHPISWHQARRPIFSLFVPTMCGGTLLPYQKSHRKPLFEGRGILQWRGQDLTPLFVDDSLLFYEATTRECNNLLDILALYEGASRQAINRQKTTLFFSPNTNQVVRLTIQNMLGAQIMTNCERYLGLPMVGGKSKVSTFREIQEQVTKRVMGWKEKHIWKARRGVLIKTVAQAIPTYSMSMFKLPKKICDDINSALAKYW